MLGITRIVIPKAGFVFAWLGTPWIRFTFITGAGVLFGLLLLRRIWSS